MEIRPERPGEEPIISSLITEAFALAEHSDGTEARIVERLRAAGALTISLVAIVNAHIVGHVAISPVMIDGRYMDWFGLGPIAVRPDRQGEGIGSAIIAEAIRQLQQVNAAGCVVLGEPDYYGRFGFRADPRLRFPGPPPRYFQILTLAGDIPSGTVAYHPAFG